MPEIILPVVGVSQKALHLCGPAVAEMILASRGVPAPADAVWQEHLWESIKANTHGRGPTSSTEPSPCPPFPTQECEECGDGAGWHCWCSTPDALARVINTHLAGSVVEVMAVADRLEATRVLIDAIDHGWPTAALVSGWQHWIVTAGYAFESGASGRRNPTGIYVHDPRGSEARQFVALGTWLDQCLRVVPCGRFEGRYVLVGASEGARR